jgi:hypothetical protein
MISKYFGTNHLRFKGNAHWDGICIECQEGDSDRNTADAASRSTVPVKRAAIPSVGFIVTQVSVYMQSISNN